MQIEAYEADLIQGPREAYEARMKLAHIAPYLRYCVTLRV